jgi:hypothetical protein
LASLKRSPRCPFIDLEKAIERARTLYRKEGRNRVAVPIAVGHWGYSPRTSGGLQTIAALKGYGLLHDSGAGENRHVRLTELALRILLDEREPSRDRAAAIQEAALQPKLFSELWNRWKDQGLPSTINMRHFLIFDKEVNENSAQDFVDKFVSTLRFAGLEDMAGTQVDEREIPRLYPPEATAVPDEADGVEALNEAVVMKRDEEQSAPAMPTPSGIRQDIFTLEEGRVVLQWPDRLSAGSLEDFEDWLQLMLRKVRRSADRDPKNR